MQEKKPASNTSNVMNKSDAGKETSQQHKQRDE